MTTDVKTVGCATPIQDVAVAMRDGDVGSMPVVEGGRLVGIVTDRDIVVRAVAEGRDASMPVGEAMTTKLFSVLPDDFAFEAIRLMGDKQVRRIPVAAGITGSESRRLVPGQFLVQRVAVLRGRRENDMSRAFVKESDDDLAAGELPERPVPAHANYVTLRGLEQLRARVRELAEQHEQLKAIAGDDSEAKRKLREVERDQRYFVAQLERAEPVDPAQHPRGEVRFGATVKVEEAGGRIETFSIVGDDEADVAAGRISWASPLARSLLGARVGDTVKWRRPAGETEVEIVAIDYLQ